MRKQQLETASLGLASGRNNDAWIARRGEGGLLDRLTVNAVPIDATPGIGCGCVLSSDCADWQCA